MFNLLKEKLLKIKSENNYRELKLFNGVDFSSNDYLGFANHPKIKEAIINSLTSGMSVGACGSRLLSGNMKAHIELEDFAKDFFASDACLFFNTGFMANYAIFTTLPDRKDFIIFDELVHASIRDGINSSLAKSIKFRHNDLSSLKTSIEKAQSLNAKTIWVSIESVYSMDGDIADVKMIFDIINSYNNVCLVVDEAHATGVFGQDGKGFSFGLHSEKLITLHTCSKGLGVSGALVCASQVVIDYLINKARSFIFTTAESPVIAVAVKKALELSIEESFRREKLLNLVSYVDNKYLHGGHKTQIIPIHYNDSLGALKAAEELQHNGFNIRAIRPPTVPTPRLRVSLTVDRTEEEIDKLFNSIKLIERK